MADLNAPPTTSLQPPSNNGGTQLQLPTNHPQQKKLSGSTAKSTNQLLVNTQHLLPRKKSVIGRLERSSFQTQRLSDVGVAFGQQITANVGLRLPASQARVVEQTRWLYLRYVFVKLRLNGLPLRDLNLTKASRARRAALLGGELKKNQETVSAPSTASALPILSSNVFGTKSHRPRTTLTEDQNLLGLSLLTANIKTYRMTGNDSDSSSQIDSQVIGSSTNNGRKFVMDPAINNQIFSVITNMIKELRGIKPELFGDTVYELIGIEKFSSLQSLLDAQMTICQELTRSEITWCRITALFSLFGAMSLDCVRLGAPEHVGPILDGFIEFVERDLALWISQQGGWESFLYKYGPGIGVRNLTVKLLVIAVPILSWLIFKTFN